MSSSREIDAAKLARANEDGDVKSFAHHMMLDHTRLTVQLKMVAPHGVKGKTFDQAYITKAIVSVSASMTMRTLALALSRAFCDFRCEFEGCIAIAVSASAWLAS